MSNPRLAKFQIGKNAITPTVLESLEAALKYHKQVRISVLKAATRDREQIKEMAQELIEKLKIKLNFRIIGFTIILFKVNSKKITQ